MTFSDSALSQEMEASSSTTEVVFHISDGSNQGENAVRITQPDRLKRWSLGLRKLMEEATSQHIPLKVDPKSGFDSAAVAWVLEKLQGLGLDVRPDPETLARHCAVLWEYKCNPDPLKNLGDSMQPRSSWGPSNIAPSASLNGGSRCWRGRNNNITCGRLITIAIVLRLQEVLEEEIKIAVWGTNKEVKVAVPLEKDIDIEAIRKKELGKLFEKVYHEIIDIGDDNEKLGKSIRDSLKQEKLGNFSKSWKKNANELEERLTPNKFLRGIEKVLVPKPQPQDHETETQVRTRGKDVPHVNWDNLFSKMIKAIKETLHVIDGREVGGNQEKKDGILNSLETFIQERYHALGAELIKNRDSIVQAWEDELDRSNHQAQT